MNEYPVVLPPKDDHDIGERIGWCDSPDDAVRAQRLTLLSTRLAGTVKQKRAEDEWWALPVWARVLIALNVFQALDERIKNDRAMFALFRRARKKSPPMKVVSARNRAMESVMRRK